MASITLRSCWSNSWPTSQLLRIGRRTASLWRVQNLGYPLHQFWKKAQDKKALQMSWVQIQKRSKLQTLPSPSCLHFSANRFFSVMAFDKLLLMASCHSVSILLHPNTHIPLKNFRPSPPLRTVRLCSSGPSSSAALPVSNFRTVCAIT